MWYVVRWWRGSKIKDRADTDGNGISLGAILAFGAQRLVEPFSNIYTTIWAHEMQYKLLRTSCNEVANISDEMMHLTSSTNRRILDGMMGIWSSKSALSLFIYVTIKWFGFCRVLFIRHGDIIDIRRWMNWAFQLHVLVIQSSITHRIYMIWRPF